MKKINALKSGDEFNNKQVCEIFGCSPQGGMRRSHGKNTLILVSNHIKSIYDDRWDGNILHYTGMGSKGDQSLTFSQNKTLFESKYNGVKIHLFEVFKDKKYTYVGEVELADETYTEKQPDIEGNERLVYVFPIKLVTGKRIVSKDDICSIYEHKIRKAKKISLDELQKRAKYARKLPGSSTQVSIRYERNEYVAEYAKRIAKGVCQLCLVPAPFCNLQGEPYLETHHIEWLSKGGLDTIENTVALCPNCHKKMHIVDADKDKELLRQRVIEL
ncbi:restriction endonuclease [Xenorhabdus stockiae]|uniref:Restriction endonuclease n=1 Tax=Xenorhabdus stockiae TaxID=351614 RepID=A0A2D0KLI4_9GAMM|nr:HNH endonuclease signature motif containing protein [Xenorhabdus stockiae]PHM64185.1 restriction endonuclease [Xenorhabdus stockiae]